MLRIAIHIAFFLTLCSICQAQDLIYSRSSFNPSYLNPAFNAYIEGGSVYTMYRNQWPSIEANFVSVEIGGSTYLPNLKSGLGISLVNDNIGSGLYTTTSADLLYNYKLTIRKSYYVSLGMSMGWKQVAIDPSAYTFYEQFDPIEGLVGVPGSFPNGDFDLVRDRVNIFDLGAGILIYNEQYFAGLSFAHLTNPQIDFLKASSGEQTSSVLDFLPSRFSLMGGYQFETDAAIGGQSLFVYPQLYFTRQQALNQINLQIIFGIPTLNFGIGGRLGTNYSDALIASIGAEVGVLEFQYAYDITMSKLGLSAGGAHEIGLKINFEKLPSYRPKGRSVKCFEFY